jgi:DNA-directed RNA polymerase subunit RPC12/RpoP
MLIHHFFYCTNCNKENKIKIEEDDRGTLQMKKGEQVSYTCTECHKKDRVHINQINAKPNKVILIGSVVVSIILTLFLLNLGIIASISFGLPVSVYLYQQNLAKSFNSYKIKTR